MAINTYFKKARLIWEEKTAGLSPLSVEPKVSFDGGVSWMSLISQAANLRNGNAVVGSNIINLADNYKQLDVGFSFTPYCIPSIVSHELEPDATNGDLPGTYYFIAKCINKTSPGLELSSDLNYDSANILNNHSKVYKVNVTANSKIHLFINYPSYISGICIYKGYAANESTFPVTLKLCYISNLTNALLETINETTTTIKLTNKFPFPKTGNVLIDSEYIEYSDCAWDSAGSFWKLTVANRGAKNTVPASHVVSSDPGADLTSVFLAQHTAGYYGELPDLTYYKQPITDSDIAQFLLFDSNDVRDAVTDSYGVPLTSPTVIGSVSYETVKDNTINGTYVKFSNSGVISANLTTPLTGSIHCFMKLTNMLETDSDPVLFGNPLGFWVKISRFNLKPYFGYGENELTSDENYYIPSLGINTVHSVGFSWRKDPDSDYLQIYMCIDDAEVINEITTILYADFIPQSLNIGGIKLSSSSFSNGINANILDWKVYNRFLAKSDFTALYNEKLNKSNIWCGKITTDINSLDYSTVSSSIALNTYDPLHTLTFTLSSLSDVQNIGSVYSVIYDNTLLNKYFTDGLLPTSSTYTYPIDPDLIQIRFDMTGDGTGFVTPIIKNISLIISDASLS
jgi:hypothetical protein